MSNTNTLTDYVLMPSADYQDMCNAIREKTGITGDIISSQIGNIIRSIQSEVVLPKYTVKFYNDTTLLQNYENVVYGSSVVYTGAEPTKDGYTFNGFEPSGARITGDTNCYAQFIENTPETPDEPEVTGEWVPFCADSTTWTGEEVAFGTNRRVSYEGSVNISPSEQYRITVNDVVYNVVMADDETFIGAEHCPVYLSDNSGDGSFWLARHSGVNIDSNTSTVRCTLKVESWTSSEPYVPEETPATLITFSVDGTEYQAEEGMTWGEWIASEHNTDGFAKYPDADVFDVISQDWDTVYDDNGVVVVTDVIVADYSYWLDCCFVEGTQVMISLDGQTKNIEDIQAGEQVVSYNVKTGENYMTTVSKAITNNSSKFMAHVEFENGTELDMTEYHPIYTQNGWRSLTNYNGYGTLMVGDIAKTINGWSKITNIVRYQNDVRTTTYTLDIVDIGENPDIEINDSFYANGIVVHNSMCI